MSVLLCEAAVSSSGRTTTSFAPCAARSANALRIEGEAGVVYVRRRHPKAGAQRGDATEQAGHDLL